MEEIRITTETIQFFGAGGTALAALWTFIRLATKIGLMADTATQWIKAQTDRVDEARKHEAAMLASETVKLNVLRQIEKNTAHAAIAVQAVTEELAD